MPKLDYVQKFKEIFKSDGYTGTSSVASTLFMTTHQLFPRAEWSKEVPALVDKNFAGWWDKQFSGVSKLLSDAEKKAAEPYRNKIGDTLTEISKRASNNVLPGAWKGAAANLANQVSGLAAAISGNMPSRDKITKDSPWASFQNASASVLVRVCACLGAQVDSRDRNVATLSGDRIEATLKLAEETQRLLELVGDPPDELKISDNEGAAEYLKAVNPPEGADQKSRGAQFSAGVATQIQQILALKEKDPQNPKHSNDLASRVGNLRGELIAEKAKLGVFDPVLAARSIVIAEAMTPEYSSKTNTGRAKSRPRLDAEQLTKLTDRANTAQDRVAEEAAEEKGEVAEKDKR